jgi:hypothetical protein
VKQINKKELSLLEQQLQQTTRRIAASLHSGAACLQSAFSVPLGVEPARSTLRAEVCACSLHHCHVIIWLQVANGTTMTLLVVHVTDRL